jgi:hypothetical protein
MPLIATLEFTLGLNAEHIEMAFIDGVEITDKVAAAASAHGHRRRHDVGAWTQMPHRTGKHWDVPDYVSMHLGPGEARRGSATCAASDGSGRGMWRVRTAQELT